MRYGFKFSIECVNGGVILRITHQGTGPLKEPYEGYEPRYVFSNLDDAVFFLKQIGAQ